MSTLLNRLFGIKPSPESLARQFRQQAKAFETEQAEQNYRLKRLKGRIEGILDRGKKAALAGDSISKRVAAMELKAAQTEAAEQERDLYRVLNARTFVQLTLSRLQRCTRTQMGQACQNLGRLMNDKQFQRLMAESHDHSQEVDLKIAAAVDHAFDSRSEENEVGDLDTSLFDQLAEADRKGDVDRVRELKRKAGARIASPAGEDLTV